MPTDPMTRPWPVRLPADLLRRWRVLAAHEGLTAAGLLRRVMVKALDGNAPVGLSGRAAGASSGRLSITLSKAEVALVREAAATEGHSLAGWIGDLIRARLEQQPLYTRQERDELTRVHIALALSVNRADAPAVVRDALQRVEAQLDRMHQLASERTRRLQ